MHPKQAQVDIFEQKRISQELTSRCSEGERQCEQVPRSHAQIGGELKVSERPDNHCDRAAQELDEWKKDARRNGFHLIITRPILLLYTELSNRNMATFFAELLCLHQLNSFLKIFRTFGSLGYPPGLVCCRLKR